jgi:hypothetical protein
LADVKREVPWLFRAPPGVDVVDVRITRVDHVEYITTRLQTDGGRAPSGQRASFQSVQPKRRSVRMQIDNAKSLSPTLTACASNTKKVMVRGRYRRWTYAESFGLIQFAQFYQP